MTQNTLAAEEQGVAEQVLVDAGDGCKAYVDAKGAEGGKTRWHGPCERSLTHGRGYFERQIGTAPVVSLETRDRGRLVVFHEGYYVHPDGRILKFARNFSAPASPVATAPEWVRDPAKAASAVKGMVDVNGIRIGDRRDAVSQRYRNAICLVSEKKELSHCQVPSASFAGVPAALTFAVPDDIVDVVAVRFRPEHFDGVLATISERYGRPTMINRNPQNAGSEDVVAVWMVRDHSIFAQPKHKDGMSWVTFQRKPVVTAPAPSPRD